MKLSIVIPVYNSESSLKQLNTNIHKMIPVSFEIIYVNDCSNDKSKEILDGLQGHIKVIHLDRNHGQQGAIFQGLKVARGDYIVTMDDDLQHDPADIMKLLESIENGYDLVYGINHEQMVNYRQLGSKLTAYFFKHRFKHMGVKRVSSFRIFTKELNRKVIKCSYKFIYLSGIMLDLTENIGQVVIEKKQRQYGQSGYNFKKLLWLFLRLNFYYGYFPEFLKPKRKYYEENYDIRCGQLPAKRYP